MIVYLTAKPIFNILLTGELLDAMTLASRHHYDHRCKEASLPGGFLYGLNNELLVARSNGANTILANLTSGDADTLLKICENTAIVNPGTIPAIRTFVIVMHKAFTHADAQLRNWKHDVEISAHD